MAILARNICWGTTVIIGLVQLGAVVDEQRQTLGVAIMARNICWGTTCITGLVQLGAVVDEQRQAFCVAILTDNICWGTILTLPVDIYAAEKDLSRSVNFSFTTCNA